MSKATNTFFNSGVMMMILVNVVVGTPWGVPGSSKVGRTGAFSHGKVMIFSIFWMCLMKVMIFSGFRFFFSCWIFHAFPSKVMHRLRPNSCQICQVLAMDRYPEHLVEASVGDVPQL